MRWFSDARLLGAAIALSAVTAARAGDEVAKLLPVQGGVGAAFGSSVAAATGCVLVGAPRDGRAGTQAGAVTLFDISQPSTPVEGATLLPDQAGAWFGESLAADDGLLLVGARWDRADFTSPGAAYLFQISDATDITRLAKLRAPDGASADWFGASVAVAGDRALVGAPGGDSAGQDAGAAYLFDISDPSRPGLIAKLMADDPAPGAWFGASVALGAGTAIIGAPRDDDRGLWAGSVYVFNAAAGEQLAKINVSRTEDGDEFGRAVAADGSWLLIGAPHEDSHSGFNLGSAYLFDLSTPSQPVQLARLLAADRLELDAFGYAVALGGGLALVGAPGVANGQGRGAVYAFNLSDPSAPEELGRVTASEAADGDTVGAAVRLAGSLALAGAPGDDDLGGDAGAAYLLSLPGCAADLNGDRVVDTRDFVAFLGAWAAADPLADWDGNGLIDTRDFVAYLGAWAEGC